MRILATCSIGGAGHLDPLLPILDALAGLGHEIMLVAPRDLAQHLERSGHAFRLAADPPQDELHAIKQAIAEHRADCGILSERELFGRLSTAAMLPTVERAVAAWRPQLVVRETCEYAGAVVAESGGIHHVQVGISLPSVDESALAIAAEALERYDRALALKIRRLPYLSLFPRSFGSSPFTQTWRYHTDAAAQRGSAEAGVDIYATLGSVAGSMAPVRGAYRLALEALGRTGRKALMTTGLGLDPVELGDLPANVSVRNWASREKRLGARAVLCHGGSGTLLGALSSGTPVVVVPLFADHLANAAALEASGAGLEVRAWPDGGAGEIADALDRVLAEPAFEAAARKVAGEMHAADSTTSIAERLTTLA
ncbi:MAG: glycosyltransferase [Actinomycetota bacterium]|nr:glycosyltransferase [Actinomycetota bacterium]